MSPSSVFARIIGTRERRSARSRPIAAVTAGVLVAAGLTVVGAAAPAAAAAPLACINTLYFSNGTAGNVGQLDLSTGTTSAAPIFATPANAGTSTNQLGIGADGTVAITGTTTSVIEYEPAASADGTVTASPKTAGVAQGTMGAINPATGLYYYGAYSGTTVNLYVFDPATNSAPAGPVVSVTTPNPPGGNGDVAFDKTGRLYIVSGSATQAALYVVEGAVPSSGTGTTLTARELSRGTTTVATNGIAFGSDGFLYLGGSTVLQKTNPITGAPTGTTFTLTGATSTDLGSCANPSTAQTVTGFDGPRAQPTDQVRVVLEGGSYGPNGTTPDFPSSTSDPDGSGEPSVPGLIIPGETYTMRQEPVGTTDLGDYTTTWTCTDVTGAVVASGTGNSATFTAPAGTDGANIVCAFVNVLPPPVAVPDAGTGVFGAPIPLPGAKNDQPGTGTILPELTVFTDPAATDGGKRLQTPEGVWTIGTDGGITFTPAPGFSGDATTEYRIVDDNGQTSTATETATVRPGPTAAPDTASTTQGTSVSIPLLGNDAPGQNADGTAGTIPPASVVFETTGQPTGAVVSTDGRRLEVPGEGVYTIDQTTGVVTFAPDPTFVGPTTTPVAYRFTDSLGNPATSTITVAVTVVDPTAVDDSTTTPQATPVTIDVVGNDVPGPGGAIVPTSTVFTDPAATDGGKALVTPEGTWRVTPAGQVEFTPADGFTGTASTPYRITDANGQQSTATVSVTVRPGPTANPDSASTPQNVDVTFPVLGNDVPGTAADGSAGTFDRDSFRFSVAPGLPAGSAVSGSGRVLTVPGEGVYTFDPTTGDVTFDPEPLFTGAATPVTYIVTDSFGNDASTTVSVTVTAVTPTAIGDAAKTPGSTPVDIDILANDEPGAPSAPLVPSSVVFTSPDATDGGKTLVVPGEGTWVVRDDGTVRFSPVPGFAGPTAPVVYRVADENGTPTTAEIVVTVGSGALAAPDTETTLQNTPVVLDVLDNDFASDLGSPCDRGETNVPAGCDTGILVPPSVMFPTAGQPVGAIVTDSGTTLTVPGEGVYSADPAGRVTFTPEPAFTGTATSVVYGATDSNGATVSSTITVTVTGVTPEAQDDSATTPFGVPVAVDLLDDDSAGDASAPLVPAATLFPATGQPAGVAVSPDGKTLTIDGQGTYVLDDAGSTVFTPAPGFTGTTTPVTYRITDANGTTADAAVQVTVRPGPSAAPDTDATLQGVPVTVQPFDNDVPSRNADDSEGAWDSSTLRFPVDGQPAGAQVLDDGTRLVVPGEGSYAVAADGSVTFTPEPAFTGSATPVTYTGVDESGNAVTSTITIDVTPVVPTAADDAAVTPFATAVTFGFAGNDDAGDPAVPLDIPSAVFEASGIPAGVTAEIRDNGKTLAVDGEGVYSLRDDGTVTFTPAADFSGSTTPVRYTVFDENGSPATAALTVTVRPGPIATADAETTPQGVPVTVSILENDRPGQLADGSDAVLDPASVVFPDDGQPAGATIGAGGKTLTVPDQGEYAIGDDGRVTFTPVPTFRGDATPVSYAVTDSLGNSATSTVTITVVGVDPIAVDDSAVTPHGTPVTVDVVGNDVPGPGGSLVPSSTVFTDPGASDGGKSLVTPEGSWRVTDEGRVEFTPADGFTGTVSTPYRVTDANGQQSTATVSVTVRPGPVANPDSASTAQNVDVSFPVLGNDVPGVAADGSAGSFDPDSFRFTVTPDLPAGSAVSDGGRVLTVPGEGVYTFDPDTGEVTFDPDPPFTGTATPVTYAVMDVFGNDASTTVAVTVTAVTPVAIGDVAKTPGSTPVVIDILENDEPGAPSAPLVPGSVVFTSPDATDGGTTLVVPGEGTFTVRDDGTVRFVPVPGFEGPTTPVTYRVDDENGTPTSAQITVTVGSGAIAAPDAATTLQNTPVSLDILDNDLASDLGNPCDPGETDTPTGCDTGVFDPASAAFPTDGQPAGAVVSDDGRMITIPGEGVYVIDPTNGVVTFIPEPAFTGVATSIVYGATDSNGAPVSSTITVTVTGVTPDAQDDRADTAFGMPVTLDLLDDDSAGDASAPLVPAATFFPATGQPDGVTVSPDGKTLTIDGQGTYVLDDAGSVVFTPTDGFTGTTTPITYRITDANGTTDDARIQVTVRPGPSATPDTESTRQGVPVTLQPLGNDTPSRNADDSAGTWDPTTLRFSSAGQPAGAQVLDGGTRLVVPGEGAYTAAPDGSVTFVPESSFTGAASSVSYTGTDDIGNAITSTIRIDVTAVVPTATDDEAATPFRTAVTFDFAGNDDPGDPAVPLDLGSAVFEPAGIPAGLTAEIRDGGKTLDVTGEGVYTLRDDGTVTFTPASDYSGTTTAVRYTIRDANDSTATAALSVTVRPGPSATADAATTPQNVPVTVGLLGNDRAGQLADGADGELDAASVVFIVDGQPAGATIGAGGKTLTVPDQGEYAIGDDGRVTFTPVPSFRGVASPVSYAVTDSLGNAASSTLTITVEGVDPIARNNSATTAPGVPVVIDVIGDDSPGTGAPLDPTSVRIVDADGDLVTELTVPGEGVWRVVDGKIVFTPARGFVGTTTPITYSVADVNGTRVTATVTVTVAAGASLPTTGGAVPWIPLGAGLLLLLGGLAILIRRRSA